MKQSSTQAGGEVEKCFYSELTVLPPTDLLRHTPFDHQI